VLESVHLLHLRAAVFGGRGVPASQRRAAGEAISSPLRDDREWGAPPDRPIDAGATSHPRKSPRGVGSGQAPYEEGAGQAATGAGPTPRSASELPVGVAELRAPRAANDEKCATGREPDDELPAPARSEAVAVTRPLRYGVQFSAEEEYVLLVERAKALLSHAHGKSTRALHVCRSDRAAMPRKPLLGTASLAGIRPRRRARVIQPHSAVSCPQRACSRGRLRPQLRGTEADAWA
jgi:hypothetical protein